jgi:membrane protein
MLKQLGGLFREAADGWTRVNAPRLGAALAFYTMLSMTPLLVICVSIAGIVFGAQAAEGRIAGEIQNLAGPVGAQAIQSLLVHSAKFSGVLAALVGLVTLLCGASGVLVELQDSLNLVWGIRASAGGIKGLIESRFFSFLMVLGVGLLLLASLLFTAAVAAVGKFFSHFLPAPEIVLHLAGIVVSFLLSTGLFAFLYKVVPATRVEWRDVWVGATVTSTLFSIGKFLIGLYIGKAGVGSAFGAAASLVVFLVWVYYSAQVFFLGAEFTRVYANRHGSRAPAAPLRDNTSDWGDSSLPARESATEAIQGGPATRP